MWRYTLDFGSSFSAWMPYQGGNVSIPPLQNWTGTAAQAWSGDHIMVQYWSNITASSDHFQHGDTAWTYNPPRRFPNFWIEGSFNQFGYDAGYQNQMSLSNVTGQWEIHFMAQCLGSQFGRRAGFDPVIWGH
jgi:alpha-1,3-glucan synthase